MKTNGPPELSEAEKAEKAAKAAAARAKLRAALFSASSSLSSAEISKENIASDEMAKTKTIQHDKEKLKTVLLVSHDYHLFRLVSVFKKLGIETYAYAANQSYPITATPWWRYFDWANFNRIQTIVHEYLGLLSYKYSNRI